MIPTKPKFVLIKKWYLVAKHFIKSEKNLCSRSLLIAKQEKMSCREAICRNTIRRADIAFYDVKMGRAKIRINSYRST